MAAVALIVFDQGGAGPAGEAFEGTVAGGAVTVTNDVNTDVMSWSIDLLDAPPDSGLAPGNLGMADTGMPTAMFTPDVPGSYRILLDVWDAAAQAGVRDRHILNFGIRNARGHIIPPFQRLPDPLPLLGSGQPGEKPDEQNYGGQLRGWSGDRTDGQLEDFFATYDDQPFLPVATSIMLSAVGEPPLYLVDLIAAGMSVTLTLPMGARPGQRFRIMALRSASTDTVTVAAPGGHTINGLPSVILRAGESGVFVFQGGMLWAWFGAIYQAEPVSIAQGVEDTDLTGFSAVGATVVDPADFPNSGGTATWQAIIETTDMADAAEIQLFNLTTASIVAGSVLSTTSLTPVLVTAAVTLAAGANLYEAQLRLVTTGAPNRATCKQAQLLINTIRG